MPRLTGGAQPKGSRLSVRSETHMSKSVVTPPPGRGRGRLLLKYSRKPSRERVGKFSLPLMGKPSLVNKVGLVLMLGPRFCGDPHGSFLCWRVDTQRSPGSGDRKSTRLNSSHLVISYA